jgi:flavodoxin
MNALIVYDSVYGNTEAIARAIAEGLRERFEVHLVPAGSTGRIGEGTDLLVVGGPTQRRGPSPELEALLERLSRGGLGTLRAAAFDTRYRMSALLSGSAARAAAKRLTRAGCRLLKPPESFFMERDQPPRGEKRRHSHERLEPGEVERAVEWGRDLALSAGSLDRTAAQA